MNKYFVKSKIQRQLRNRKQSRLSWHDYVITSLVDIAICEIEKEANVLAATLSLLWTQHVYMEGALPRPWTILVVTYPRSQILLLPWGLVSRTRHNSKAHKSHQEKPSIWFTSYLGVKPCTFHVKTGVISSKICFHAKNHVSHQNTYLTLWVWQIISHHTVCFTPYSMIHTYHLIGIHMW